MIQAVIFDMDGVLFDTERLGVKQQLQACLELGYPISEDLVMRTMGASMTAGREIFENTLGPGFPYERMIAHWTELMFSYIKEKGMPLMPGVRETLAALSAKKIRIGVATSNNRSIVEHYMAASHLAGAFGAVVCGDGIEKSKPAPDIYLAVAKKLGVSPEMCMGVEDSANGVKAVRAAGMICVMVPDMIPFTPELAPHVDHCVPVLTDILTLL